MKWLKALLVKQQQTHQKLILYTQTSKKKDIKKWDRELENYGLILHHTVKYIDSLFEEDEKNQLKRIITKISVKIIEINIEIWKYRCKILYSGNAAII